MRPFVILAPAVCGLALALASSVVAQSPAAQASPGQAPAVLRAASVPFGPGEELRYRVKLNFLPVGEGYLRVEGVDTVRGYPSYRLAMGFDASTMLGALQVHDRYESWMDTGMLVSRRFIRDIKEPGYKSRRHYEIYPEERRWTRVGHDEEGELPSILALDELSFIYFVRTLSLEVGETRELNRYFKEGGNPVRIRVLRKERIEVPAGVFDVIVVQPTFQTSGIFSEGGEAELYFTDDEARRLVLLTSKVPVVGSLSLHLMEVTEGAPLSSGASGGASSGG